MFVNFILIVFRQLMSLNNHSLTVNSIHCFGDLSPSYSSSLSSNKSETFVVAVPVRLR